MSVFLAGFQAVSLLIWSQMRHLLLPQSLLQPTLLSRLTINVEVTIHLGQATNVIVLRSRWVSHMLRFTS